MGYIYKNGNSLSRKIDNKSTARYEKEEKEKKKGTDLFSAHSITAVEGSEEQLSLLLRNLIKPLRSDIDLLFLCGCPF
jgi:hypothetical protein